MRKVKTVEEKVAEKIATIVSDLRLDLDSVGTYLAHLAPNVSYRRLIEIAETAEYEKEKINDRRNFGSNTLFD